MCALKLIPLKGLYVEPIESPDMPLSATNSAKVASCDFWPPTHKMEERKPSSESDTLWATDLGEDGQEPCVTFKYKVIQLVAELFPFVEASSQLVIDEVGAGSFNRVIGVTILPSKTRPESNTGRHSSKLLLISQPQEYVIRMPLDGRDELSRLSSETKFDIAILQVIGSRLAIPVPKVLECDLSANNALAKPFVVQTRLRGQSLQSLAETLNIRQMASAVEQVTKIIEKVAAFTTPAAGFISTENLNFPSTFHIQLMQYPIPTEEVAAMFPGSKNANEQTALPQTPFELLVDHCYRWRKYEESVYHYGNKSIWAQILTIVRTLNRRGWLGDRLHLVHDDLYPRNILAVIDSPDTVEITGIVDWDMSFFGPKFVALRPPYWAWMEDYAYERDEDNASIDPEEEHNMLLKIAFMEAASEDFFQFALSQEAILARKLFYILVGGLMSDERRAAAYELFREWSALYPADIIDNSSLL